MEFPKDLLYTKDHEWAKKVTDELYIIGITDHAQNSLGDIVYVELPRQGKELKAHDTFGVVESIKAVSDLYSPLTGVVQESNAAATNDPSLINKSPYADGWLLKIKVTDKNSLSSLMSVADYQKLVDSLK